MLFLKNRNYLEQDFVCLERCQSYMNVQSQKNLYLPLDKLEYSSWPKNEKISFKNNPVKYRPDTEEILHNLSFEIKDKEKIGIIGEQVVENGL